MLEKAECRHGNIPFLWRYKRGGLIQKYERIEEDGKVFYQNVLNVSIQFQTISDFHYSLYLLYIVVSLVNE